MYFIFVVMVDGFSGVGKGMLSSLLVKKLGWYFLDSGVIYCVLVVVVLYYDFLCEDEECVVLLVIGFDVSFEINEDVICIIFEGEDVIDDICIEDVGVVVFKVVVLF